MNVHESSLRAVFVHFFICYSFPFKKVFIEFQAHHVNSLYEQQRRLIITLRKSNEVRSIEEMCLCGSVKEEDNFIIRCLLCHAKFHCTLVKLTWSNLNSCFRQLFLIMPLKLLLYAALLRNGNN